MNGKHEDQEPTFNGSAWLGLSLQMVVDTLQRILVGPQKKDTEQLRIMLLAVDSRSKPVDIVTVTTSSANADELMQVLTKSVKDGLQAYSEAPHRQKN